MKSVVHLGFEVGSGASVDIPVSHLAIAGQTQMAGKTTACEALASRSDLRVLAFLTKRGEGSFTQANGVQPYFHEEVNWQYVASILEASRGEKLKFERAWIIRASKGARSLVDVHANVRKAMETAKGLSADVYLTLDAYLDEVVPQIQRTKWASTIELQPGINVMNLGSITEAMQHLVIRSVLTWVLANGSKTAVVIPEAWKFIPQSRGTPVKLAAEAYVRQGAAMRNFLWLDSQDLGGIDKGILRSVSVWLLGVQREANEIKRTLDNIPGIPSKPKPSEIATLGLGEFFACWADKRVKTYVQPVWMEEGEAHSVAMGSIPAAAPQPEPKEEPEMCEKHAQLEQELIAIRQDNIAISNDLAAQRKRATRAEERAREAEETAGAAGDLGRALARLMPAGAGGSAAVVDVEKIANIVLARLPAGGAGPVTVTPPEKLRKDFQQEESDRIVAAVRDLDPLAKRVLKLLQTTDGYVGQPTINLRLGRTTSGGSMTTMGGTIKTLGQLGFVDVKDRQGAKNTLRDKIAADLGFYQATEQEVEAVYQSVLYVLATEGEAAA